MLPGAFGFELGRPGADAGALLELCEHLRLQFRAVVQTVKPLPVTAV